MFRHVWVLAALLALLMTPALLTTPANAQVQKYVCVVLDHDTGILYDCDLTNGLTSHLRHTGIKGVVGIAFFGATTSSALYALTDDHGTPVPNALYAINPYTGLTTLIGKTGLSSIHGGDLLYNPREKVLYAMLKGTGQRPAQMLRINTKTGAASVLYAIPNPKSGFRNINSLTMNKPSTLIYATDSQRQSLLQIDPDNGRILTELPLSDSIGDRCGMRLNRYGNNLCYLADGGAGGTHSLYAVDLETAVLTKVGDLKGVAAIDGLTFIPKTPKR